MQTLTLSSVLFELQNANLTNGGPGYLAPGTDGDTRSLIVSGIFKLGTVQLCHFNQTYPLTEAELASTPIGDLEILALDKVKEQFGITA